MTYVYFVSFAHANNGTRILNDQFRFDERITRMTQIDVIEIMLQQRGYSTPSVISFHLLDIEDDT